MVRTKVLIRLLLIPMLLAAACTGVAPAAAPASSGESAAAASAAEPAADANAKFAEILQCVQENFPAENYISNDYLPAAAAPWEPMACESYDKIKVLMPWVLNDEEAPWYNAVEKGFFKDVCLEVELVPGGPGIQPIQLLAGGAVDIAVVAGASRIPASVASPTPADIVAVGTMLKHSPYIWMGLDKDIAQDQLSAKKLTPQDLVGKKIGLQAGDEYFAEYLIQKYNLPADAFTLVEAGFTPDPLLVGAIDYFAAWIVNQPRLAEGQGFMNWTAFRFSDWGWDGYSDVSTVNRTLLETNPELVKRYLAAVNQGMIFLLENPEESAEIAVNYGVDAQMTTDQVLRRFELQKDLIEGSDDLPVMHMSAERWNSEVATLVQYGQLELAACQP